MLKPLFYLISLLYGAVIRLRNRLFETGIFKSWQSPVPVVSIGNISAGGAGKTPFSDWIVKYYLSQGKRVAIVSRGYKRETSGGVLVSDGKRIFVSSREAGDEPMMLAQKNPAAIVVVSEKRRDGIEEILSRFADALPDVIVLDDAYQHRQVARDLNLLVIHAEKSPFSDALLPLGRLREPLREISRADMVLLSKISPRANVPELLKNLAPFGKPVVKSRIKIVGLRSFFSDALIPLGDPSLQTSAFAFSGIADPKNFMETLEQAGLFVAHYKHFSDHYTYTEKDIDLVTEEVVQHKLNLIVTTEKDYHRLKSSDALFLKLQQHPCFYIEIEFEVFEGAQLLREKLATVLTINRPQ
ncbi:MAG: tetraacyldisaccharide 4'-kinase [Chlorobiales bacterium]|nr:tetraacyldisaccharide 4'-kinase [Chlorobiales bacterium]